MSERPEDVPVGADEVLVESDEAAIGRGLRVSAWVLAVLVAVVAGVLLFQPEEDQGPAPVEVERQQALVVGEEPAAPRLPFSDVSAAWGVDFVHENGARGAKLLPETMGAGCAILDADGDGDNDLFFANAAPWPGDAPSEQATRGPALFSQAAPGRFVRADVGSLGAPFYGTGVAVGDVEGDGDNDLLLTAVGRNRLLLRDGDDYRDDTARAGLAGGADDWSTSAAFFDLENDGDLDLFVCNYVRWSAAIDAAVDYRLTGVGRAYGPPTSFEGAFSLLFRNEGDGRFADISAEAGVQVVNAATGFPVGKALGVLPIDLGRDGLTDLAVANDTVRNFLFVNAGDGTLREDGVAAGLAYDVRGNATGAMGIDAADFRNEGSLALGMGNFANEMTSLYVAGRDDFQFSDLARVEGIGAPSRAALSFGLVFLDADLDGRQDLLQTNGHLEEEINAVQPSQHYRQASQLFWNAGTAGRTTFTEVEAAALGDLARPVVGRGVATGDLDGDGDLDVVLTQSGERALVLRNDQATGHHWLRVRLRPSVAALGARVVLRAGGVRQTRWAQTGRSYLSAIEDVQTFGLGAATSVESLVVHWPDGSEQVVPVPGVDRLIEVRQEL